MECSLGSRFSLARLSVLGSRRIKKHLRTRSNNQQNSIASLNISLSVPTSIRQSLNSLAYPPKIQKSFRVIPSPLFPLGCFIRVRGWTHIFLSCCVVLQNVCNSKIARRFKARQSHRHCSLSLTRKTANIIFEISTNILDHGVIFVNRFNITRVWIS